MLPALQDYLEISSRRFDACLSPLDEAIDLEGVEADFSLHYVKFDQHTKTPKFNLLAKALASHVVRFCLSAATRERVKSQPDYSEDEGQLFQIARDYFRKLKDCGEVGELLLFFLLEAAIGAPQVVCKMELKTNPNDEVKGADGIHVKWDDAGEHLDVFLGEAKMYQSIGGAMTDALASIEKIYDEGMLDTELHLVTSHFKHLDEQFQDAVTAWVNRETAPVDCHVIHACLIGWDFSKYGLLETDREQLFLDFETHYRTYCKNIKELLDKRMKDYRYRHLSFRFLFVPFASVGDFRAAFYRELLGADVT